MGELVGLTMVAVFVFLSGRLAWKGLLGRVLPTFCVCYLVALGGLQMVKDFLDWWRY